MKSIQDYSYSGHFIEAVQNYKDTIDKLEIHVISPNQGSSSLEEFFFEIYRSRRILEDELARLPKIKRKIHLKDLYKQDERLKNNVNSIKELTQLASWKSQNLPVEAWSWLLGSLPKNWKQWDACWSLISLVLFGCSISITADIARRFFIDGPDPLGTFVILFQSSIALLSGGTALSKFGLGSALQPLERLLSSWKFLPRDLWHEFGLLLSSLVFLLIVFCHSFGLQNILAPWYISQGEELFKNGKIIEAQIKFKRAVALDPGSPKAYYYLARAYESLQQTDNAIFEYQSAIEKPIWKKENKKNLQISSKAFNNLANIYILKADKYVDLIQKNENYYRAFGFLDKIATNGFGKLDSIDKYNYWLNKARVSLGLGSYSLVEPSLKNAREIENQLKSNHKTGSPRYSSCVVAQMKETLFEKKSISVDEKSNLYKDWTECSNGFDTLKTDLDTVIIDTPKLKYLAQLKISQNSLNQK